MRYFVTGFFAVLIAAALPAVALAAQWNYTFNVPVTLGNFPKGDFAQALCKIYSGPAGTGTLLTGGGSPMTMSTGAPFSGTFTVAATWTSLSKPASYVCTVQVIHANNGDVVNLSQEGWYGTTSTTGALP